MGPPSPRSARSKALTSPARPPPTTTIELASSLCMRRSTAQLEAIQLHLGAMSSIRDRPGGEEATELLGKTRNFRCLLEAERFRRIISSYARLQRGSARRSLSNVPQLEAAVDASVLRTSPTAVAIAPTPL